MSETEAKLPERIYYYDGAYTVRRRVDGDLEFLRNGEVWPTTFDMRFNNVIAAMFCEQLDSDAKLTALRARVAKLEAALGEVRIGLSDHLHSRAMGGHGLSSEYARACIDTVEKALKGKS